MVPDKAKNGSFRNKERVSVTVWAKKVGLNKSANELLKTDLSRSELHSKEDSVPNRVAPYYTAPKSLIHKPDRS